MHILFMIFNTFQDSKWRNVGKYTGGSISIKGTFFPGGHLKPVVGAGKIGYKIAAFIPMDDRLEDLAALGKSWVCIAF